MPRTDCSVTGSFSRSLGDGFCTAASAEVAFQRAAPPSRGSAPPWLVELSLPFLPQVPTRLWNSRPRRRAHGRIPRAATAGKPNTQHSETRITVGTIVAHLREVLYPRFAIFKPFNRQAVGHRRKPASFAGCPRASGGGRDR